VVEILANPVTRVFEMTVAGSGMGFCGAQLKSNGTYMNVTGSVDSGATCDNADSNCVNSATLATVLGTNCTETLVNTFTLPPLGRQNYSTFGASKYPGGTGNYVILTTNTSDSVYFGPTAPVV
jgi:hypothetical protein